MPARQPRPKPPIYIFRIRIKGGYYAPQGGGEIWREVEIPAGEPLATLGFGIPYVFGFEDMHLWSFFMSGEIWDKESEYSMLGAEIMSMGLDDSTAKDAGAVRLADVTYPGDDGAGEFAYLFDYGDGWEFGVRRVGVSDAIDKTATYPRLSASQGDAPPQYPDEEEDEDEDFDEGG